MENGSFHTMVMRCFLVAQDSGRSLGENTLMSAFVPVEPGGSPATRGLYFEAVGMSIRANDGG